MLASRSARGLSPIRFILKNCFITLAFVVPVLAINGCARQISHGTIELDVSRSDVVVMGVLDKIEILGEERPADRPGAPKFLENVRWTRGRGSLRVRVPIWGRAYAGDVLTLPWTRATGFPEEVFGSSPPSPLEEPASVDYQSLVGASRIWLLSNASDGTFKIEAILKPEARSLVEDLLKMNPIRITHRGMVALTEPVRFNVEFRNATNEPMSVPALEMRGNRVVHGSRLHLSFFRLHKEPEPLERLDAGTRIDVDPNLPDLILQPRESHAVSIDLSKIFALQPCSGYWVEIGADGLPGYGWELITSGPRSGSAFDCLDRRPGVERPHR